MKRIRCLSAIIFSLFTCFNIWAQENGTFTFQMMDYKGSPIQKARLIVLSGESHMASPGGVITYLGEINYVKKNGKMVQIREMPHYITAKAPGYKDRTIDLTQYALGAYIVVQLDKLDKMSSDYKSINVYVKDKDGKHISGASVLVNPGKSTSTDAKGYAEALHTILISGEYIMIEVQKEGYKIQRQHIPSGDAPRTENGIQIPPATAYFTLEKGENDVTVFHINVEVLDYETDEPISGASVKLNLSDGDSKSGSTNAKGEVRLSDMEYSFGGLTAKVVVTKPGYEEKWSDITADLMTGKDNSERQFLIYLKKDKTVCWPGSSAAWDPQTQKKQCYCNPGLVWNSTKTACVDPKEMAKGCVGAEIESFSKLLGSWKSYRLHMTIGGSCDKVTGTWKVTEWCEGVDETYNASLARINGTITGKMQNGSLQLRFVAPAIPNTSHKGTDSQVSVKLNADGTLYCSFSCNSGVLKKQ